MATVTWISTDGDWSNTASWDTGSVPTSADNVVFDGSVQTPVVSGLDQRSAGTLNSITTMPDYGGKIGFTNNPLTVDVTYMNVEGYGGVNHRQETSVVGAKGDTLYVNAPGALSTFHRDYDDANGADFDQVHICSGFVTIASGFGAANLRVTESLGAITYVSLETGSGFSRVFVDSGNVMSAASITPELIVAGGEVTLTDRTGLPAIAIIQMGGVVNYDASNNCLFYYMSGGLLDFTRTSNTRTISELRVFPGSIVYLDDNTTVTMGGLIYDEPYVGGP